MFCATPRFVVDSTPLDGRFAIRIMATDEEALIARQTLDLISGEAA